MTRSTTCNYHGKEISIEEALDIKLNTQENLRKNPDFQCPECGQRVNPFQGSYKTSAHFEYLERNPDCSLSDPWKPYRG